MTSLANRMQEMNSWLVWLPGEGTSQRCQLFCFEKHSLGDFEGRHSSLIVTFGDSVENAEAVVCKAG